MSTAELQKTVLLSAVGLGTIGVLFYNIMPLYLGSLQDSSALSHHQIGLIAGALFLGFNVLSASSYFWINKYSFRHICVISTLCLCLFLGLKMYMTSFIVFIILSLLIGAASGALSSVSAKIISDSRNVTFWYGIKSAVESGAGVILLFILPVSLIPRYGFNGAVGAMLVVIFVFACFSLRYIPCKSIRDDNAEKAVHQDSVPKVASNLPVIFALVTILILDFGGSAIWAFEERISIVYGFDPAWVGMVLGMSLLFAVIGPGIAVLLGERFGNRLPFVFCAAIMLCGVVAVISSSENSTLFAIGACLFLFGWGASVPFMFAQVAVTDPNGRYITLAMPAMGIGSMVGPVIAGLLFSDMSLVPVQNLVAIAIILSTITIWLSGQNNSQGNKHYAG